jgi:hypothetical protein
MEGVFFILVKSETQGSQFFVGIFG